MAISLSVESQHSSIASPVYCQKCKKDLSNRVYAAYDKFYHPQCFSCDKCEANLSSESLKYFEIDDQPWCKKCYLEKNDQPGCYGCKKPTNGESITRMLGREYHVDCAKCDGCKKLFPVNPVDDLRAFFKFQNEPFCLKCNSVRIMMTTNCDITPDA